MCRFMARVLRPQSLHLIFEFGDEESVDGIGEEQDLQTRTPERSVLGEVVRRTSNGR